MSGTAPLLNASLRTAIVVGVDDSPSAVAAAGFAQNLAALTGATCHLLHIVPTGLDPVEAGTRVRLALRQATPPVDPTLLEIRQGPVVDELLARAGRLDAGLIVLGGKHHSLIGRWVAGSTAIAVVRRSLIPVLVTRGTPAGVARVLTGADATPAAFGAIRHAEQWAGLWGAAMRVVHAIAVPAYLHADLGGFGFEDLRRQGEAEARRTVAPLIGRKDVEVITDVGDPAGVLTEQARYWQADLLVVARHDRSALGRFWLGSVTERLLDGLPTSILVVPATEIEVEEHVPVAAVEVPVWHA